MILLSLAMLTANLEVQINKVISLFKKNKISKDECN